MRQIVIYMNNHTRNLNKLLLPNKIDFRNNINNILNNIFFFENKSSSQNFPFFCWRN